VEIACVSPTDACAGRNGRRGGDDRGRPRLELGEHRGVLELEARGLATLAVRAAI